MKLDFHTDTSGVLLQRYPKLELHHKPSTDEAVVVFSVSLSDSGQAPSEEAITGLKGSSGITLQQDIRKDCSQSGLRAWLENGSQCRDEIIAAAIG